MEEADDLRDLLRRIDGRGYKAYKELARRSFDLGSPEAALSLHVDTVQGDPFAAPSRVRLQLPLADAGLPQDLHEGRTQRTALEDFIARAVAAAIRRETRGQRGTGKGGRVGIDAGGQSILERTAVRIGGGAVEARLEVGLPAAGRRVLGGEAIAILLEELPRVAGAALRMPPLSESEARAHVDMAENHEALQTQLAACGLVAFVADGSVLPRESGASDRPARRGAVPFASPEPLRVTLELARPIDDGRGGQMLEVSGLGIPEGVTLIVGGGYHGKSTLLRAVEGAVHPHLPGDGRELVATRSSAVKIRAEDGRRVAGCDISGFISDLPGGLGGGRSTECFSSDDASGSTSQAANIVEALEAGSTLLLLDEDTSATNFMVRDARMQALVHPEREPITPFVDRVRELYDRLGVSTVLVMGGSGDYFEAADTVIEMHDYRPRDVSAEAGRIAAEHPASRRLREADRPLDPPRARIPVAASLDPSRGRREEKIDARRTDALVFGTDEIELRAVEQLQDASQTRAIGWLWVRARDWMGDGVEMAALLDRIETFLDEEGLDAVCRWPTHLARPRRYELAAALNRLRSLEVRQA
jgi:predicted ABC-class ATPase